MEAAAFAEAESLLQWLCLVSPTLGRQPRSIAAAVLIGADSQPSWQIRQPPDCSQRFVAAAALVGAESQPSWSSLVLQGGEADCVCLPS